MRKSQLTDCLSKISFVLLFIGISLSLHAQEFQHEKLWSFEQINPKQWTVTKGNTVKTSDAHYKHGKHSLLWSWKKNGSITLNHTIGFEPFDPEGEDKSIPSFAVWVYNEQPVDDHITFVFATDDTDNCHFDFGLNFKGWRAAWVSFERDMQGEPVGSMNQMRIEGPKSLQKGRLFIDHMFLCQAIDSRHHTPDQQVPFVNKGTKSHWLIQQKASLATPDMALPSAVDKETQKALKTIEKRFQHDILKKQSVSDKKVADLQKQFELYDIKRNGDRLIGLPIWFGRNAELYLPYITHKEAKTFYNATNQNVKAYFDFMMKVASAHANSTDFRHRDELENMFIDLFDHMLDQGIAAGSGLGTIHHYGYNWRNYYRSLFIMRDVLAKNDRLDDAVEGLQWFAALGEVFHQPETYGMDMDAFNTQVMGRLASVLIMKDSPEKVQYLQCFSRWIDNGLMPAPGLNDAFKIDGSSYHHANHYPAYATGGMTGAVRMVYFMSSTPFQVSQEAHYNLKRALLTMRFYCNKLHWPTSMSGRHPEGKGKLVPDHFAILANAGSPDGREDFDSELAAAYLRLSGGKKPKYARAFSKVGIEAEATPNGHITMPYACSSIHRRDNWAASVRGHSRYLWASEQYLGANLYGRYLAHGQLQVMGAGKPVTQTSSGFVQEGWDWNRFPGTTVINLPIDELRADIRNVDQFSGYEEMLFSDEAFAGGVTNKKNGVYAFILHEHDKYQGSLRARKSYFFFDDIIVCLGSGIENTNDERPTETVLFQNHQAKTDAALLINGERFTADNNRFEGQGSWMMDNKGNGYLLPEGQIYVQQGLQYSRDESSEKPTKGTFSLAVIEHGKAPKEASYHYCVLPSTTSEKVKEKAKQQAYRVLSQSVDKHIVYNNVTMETGYVFYEAAKGNSEGLIKNTNLPCIAMSKQDGNSVYLNVVNPDLALYEGEADEIYKDGKRVERSIYSRPWRSSPSLETQLEIEVNGLWKAEAEGVTTKTLDNGNTLLIITCQHGLTQDITLEKTL
ncbi:chondroitinase family polysaccharide lyase [Carboxylicivirga sp. RSCT41]|uniref:chondroitinase family polysaccharide lyase n=1 Tax=Carboxylicivirga agarovorans TaxID=3417570 RepID=UPI003D359257